MVSILCSMTSNQSEASIQNSQIPLSFNGKNYHYHCSHRADNGAAILFFIHLNIKPLHGQVTFLLNEHIPVIAYRKLHKGNMNNEILRDGRGSIQTEP